MDPQLSVLVRRGIRRGWLTLGRERNWLTTLGAFTGLCIVVQLVIIAGMGVQAAESSLRARTDLRLEVRDGVDDAEFQKFYASLQQLPAVENVEYVTKEQALDQERARDPNLDALLEQFDLGNPFPDTVSVTLRSFQDYDAFAEFIGSPQWASVVDPTFLSKATSQEQQVRDLLRVTTAARGLATFFLVLTSIVLLFVVIELVRRRCLGRRDEIFVERLVGAPSVSVVLPFATEGALLLAAAVFVSIGCVALAGTALPMIVPAVGADGAFAAFASDVTTSLAKRLPFLIFLEALAVPVLALAGAWLGLRPMLKTSRLPVTE